MIDLACARQLLDFGRRIGPGRRAEEQLEGAVALHHMLEINKVAYLADEVGMGKTYVALGVLALYRHFNPRFRALIIAPRENIQRKWQKELSNFTAHNVTFSDLRVRDLDGRSTRPMVHCGNLFELAHEVGVDPDRDFFVRMPSFSLGLGKDPRHWRQMRDRVRKELPWLPPEAFSLKNKRTFKDRVACALCCGLPTFDLVIVDEAHNLKHGFGVNVAARNRTMGIVFGHPDCDVEELELFKGYGPRAKRVLLLSATPIEDDYRQLWNQLSVFDRGRMFPGLVQKLTDDEKKEIARRFLIRRVTVMHAGGRSYTKNQYRREWRYGGVEVHDEPLEIRDQRERLIVALMQKKVSELLGLERFGASFQVGMLASFESFLETSQTRAARDQEETDDEVASNFDDGDQTDDAVERRGLDVTAINAIARDHRARFHEELPHPKMNGLIRDLDGAWCTNRKALVFVRRVRSVVELKRRLDDRYDKWLIGTLRERLPPSTHERLDGAYESFKKLKKRARDQGADSIAGSRDQGDVDSFFAYFFRGDGPPGVVSGATISGRFITQGSVYATFFEDNHVAWLLGAKPGGVVDALAAELGLTRETVWREIAERGQQFLSDAKIVPRGPAFTAAQAAAVQMLAARDEDLRAQIVWHELYQAARQTSPRQTPEPDLARWLETPTFFTELRERSEELREALWRTPKSKDIRDAFREQEQRAQLLAAAARLGHALIDLYVLAIHELGTLEAGTQVSRDVDVAAADAARIKRYLDLLEHSHWNRNEEFGAYDELAAICEHYPLLLDVNAPEARSGTLAQTAQMFAQLLRRQMPIGGMSGGSTNQTLIRQFRMPGYPFVLIATDVLQEGEDLHTFCSRVYHYGISWTPSAMEQRTGRIDRVRSQTDRRISRLQRELQPDDKLEVFFPHLGDTVESLQVRRVLERMDRFLRLMHEGLAAPDHEDRRVNVDREILREVTYPEPIRGTLETAFAVPSYALQGGISSLARSPSQEADARRRLEALHVDVLGGFNIRWERHIGEGPLLGTALVSERVQPFALYLGSVGEHLRIRCISPVGEVSLGSQGISKVMGHAALLNAPVAALVSRRPGSYNLTVEDDVLLGNPQHDAARVGLLVHRIVVAADTLELALLKDQDAPIGKFARDLRREGRPDG